MAKDPIVDETRRVRREIEWECRDDLADLYKHAVDIQKKAKPGLVVKDRKLPKVRVPA